MTARWISGGLLLTALAAGTVSDVPVARPPVMRGEFHVLAVDFHVHPFPLSWSTLGPWDLALEARHQGLDAVAIAGHNHVWVGQAARWISRIVGGVTVIPAEEIHPPRGHIVALGIDRTIDWRLPAERAIDEVHRQGGVAIAAHPVKSSWRVWTPGAMQKLDAAEVLQPVTILLPDAGREMREFRERANVAAIGSSDYHGLGPVGLCRTYVLARDDSEAAILEAVRAGRTEVAAWTPPPAGPLAIISRVCGILGLLIALFRGIDAAAGLKNLERSN
jgi:predicted metal-dependent phosphoesterase TrpH